MAQPSITLTASMRSNLSSLKTIQSQMDKTQEKLSTGKKVNNAIDNASSYYQSRALTNRASDLEGLLDNMGQGIQTIQAANEGIEAITSYVDQLKSIANSAFALDTSDAEVYAASIKSYQDQYDQILNEIKNLVKDSSYQGVNLLDGGKLSVTFNESRSHNFTIQGDNVITGMGLGATNGWTKAKPQIEQTTTKDLTYDTDKTLKAGSTVYEYEKSTTGTGLAVKIGNDFYEYTATGTEAVGNKVTDIKDGTTPAAKMITDESAKETYATSIDQTLTKLSKAVDYLRSYSTELGNNYTVIETRQDFTEAMVDVLETGSDKLVLADMNEESANYLALQTRQQLAVNSLSLASQSAQSVLSLF